MVVLEEIEARHGRERQLKPSNERRISVGGIADWGLQAMGWEVRAMSRMREGLETEDRCQEFPF